MGQVFKWGDIIGGRIPKPSDFTDVLSEIRKQTKDDNSITDVLVCGSVVRGDQTFRSDIDCLLMYRREEQARAFERMQALSSLAFKRNVPATFLPCDNAIRGTRMHHFGGSFRRHIETAITAKGVLKGDPLSALASTTPERDELEGYLRVKMYNLQEAWAGFHSELSEERRVGIFKKLLEAPMHIARKTLNRIRPLADDSKMYIQEQYIREMPRSMVEGFERLLGLDAEYTREVERQLAKLNAHSYQKCLADIAARAGEVLGFVRQNLLYVQERFP